MLYSKAQTHLAIWNWILSTNQIKCTLYQRIRPKMVGTPVPSSSTSAPSLAGAFLDHRGCPLVHFLSPWNKEKAFLHKLELSICYQEQRGHSYLFSYTRLWNTKWQESNSYLFGFCLCFLLFLCWGGICCSHSSRSCSHCSLFLLMLFVFLVLFILFMLLILLFLLLFSTPFLIWILQ